MTTGEGISRRSVGELTRRAAGDYLAPLQERYLGKEPEAVARLAQLRRGAGKVPADVPELWGVTGIERIYAYAEELYPEQDLLPRQAERAEAAMFLTVTLYALHQQFRAEAPMHKPGIELGEAVRRLMPLGTIDEPLRRRFVRVGTAESPDVLADRLCEVVCLLRRGAKRRNRRVPVPLDYALLAEQLYEFLHPDGARRVRDSWGRSFHAYLKDLTDDAACRTPDDDQTKDSG